MTMSMFRATIAQVREPVTVNGAMWIPCDTDPVIALVDVARTFPVTPGAASSSSGGPRALRSSDPQADGAWPFPSSSALKAVRARSQPDL